MLVAISRESVVMLLAYNIAWERWGERGHEPGYWDYATAESTVKILQESGHDIIKTEVPTWLLVSGTTNDSADNFVTGVEEKPDLAFEILAGIYFFKPDIFESIPDDTYFGMDNLIHRMLAESKPISRYQISEYWLDIGQVEDYTQAREEYSKHF